HLAYILGEPDPNKLTAYLRVQCMGTANVFEAARLHGVRRVVYASSVAVYGLPPVGTPPVDEDVPPVPDTFYGACKLWCEHIAELYFTGHGLDTVGLRPCSVFGIGRGARGSMAGGLSLNPARPHFMVAPERIASGEPAELPPDDQVADWIYGADAAEAWYR